MKTPSYLPLPVCMALSCAPLSAGETLTTTEPAEDATLFPIPILEGDWRTREVMTGDWGGLRQRLADQGIQFEVQVGNYFGGVIDGGTNSHWEYAGTSDYRFKLDTSKAGLWPGGFFEIHAESYWGTQQNLEDGSLLPAGTDTMLNLPREDGTYIPHVTLTQFLSKTIAVQIGKIDTTLGDSNPFAHGYGDERFSNLAFSFNPVTTTTTPYSSLGAVLLYIPNEQSQFSLSIIDSEGDIGSAGFDTVFDDGTTFAAEGILKTNFFGKPGQQLLGGTWSNGDFSTLSDPRLILPPSTGVAPVEKENSSWSVYYNLSQYICYDKATGKGWGAFGRLGFADEKTSPVDFFISGGLGGDSPISGRENDRWGIGYFYAETSDDLSNIITDRVLEGDEHGMEIYYDFEITPWCRLAADLQIISPIQKRADTATVLGFRSIIRF